MVLPADLTEALGVSPLYHLIPKQDLAPLLSFSRLDPAGLKPKRFLSNASLALTKHIEEAVNGNPEGFQHTIEELSSEFAKFEHPELDQIKFRIPVITGYSERDADTVNLLPMKEALYGSMPAVESLDLVEFEASLDITDITKDHLELLEPDADEEKIRLHNNYYDSKFHSEFGGLKRIHGRTALTTPEPRLRKRIHIDESQLADATMASVYNIIDKAGHEEESLLLPESTLFVLLQNFVRLASKDKVSQLNTEYLQRIQRLCSHTITNAEENLLSNANASSHLDYAFSATLASSIVLLIMTSGSNEKRLHIETYISSIVTFITSFVQEHIIAKQSSTRVIDTRLTQSVSECLNLLALFLEKTNADEHVLTRLEYMAIEVIFAETASKTVDDLRNTTVSLLVRIFKAYSSQRQFIIHEVLSNFKRLPHQKSQARQLRLSRGAHVLFFSVLLLRLTQSLDGLSLKKEVINFLTLSKSTNPQGATNLKRASLLNELYTLYGESTQIADIIAQFFLDKLSAADVNYKASYQSFLDDMLVLLESPEWPGAEVIVSSMMRTFSISLQSSTLGNSLEPFALDVVGRIGNRILELRLNNDTNLAFNGDLTVSNLNNIEEYLMDVLRSLQLRYADGDIQRAFYFSLLKAIAILSSLHGALVEDSGFQPIFAKSEVKPTISKSGTRLLKAIDNLLLILTLSKVDNLSNSSDETKARGSYISLVLSQSLNPLYETYLSLLVTSLESSKIKVATKAIRLLSSLVDMDTGILLTSRISKSVSKLLVSNSPLSRDAVIDLMGKYIFTNPELTTQYYKPISDRSADESILVRKRVTKLMKDMYLQTKESEIKLYIAIRLLRRLEDEEENIVELAKSSILEIWFSRSTLSDTGDDTILSVSRVMMDVVGSGNSNSNLLLRFIADLVFNKGLSLNKVLKNLLDTTLDFVVDRVDTHQQKDAEKALHLVSVLVDCDGNLLAQDQLIALQPYLVDSGNTGEAVCFYALRILRTALQTFKVLRNDYIKRTHAILLKRLTKFDVKELHEAMPAIAILCDKLNDKIKLANASISCMRLLKPYTNEAAKTDLATEAPKIIKLLHLLGSFAAICEFEDVREPFISAKLGIRDNETVVSLISKYLLYFCKMKSSSQIQVAALGVLLHVCTYHPRLFMSQSIIAVLDNEFEQGSNQGKLTIIDGFNKFLSKEDRDAIKRNGSQTKSSHLVKLDVAVFHGESLLYVNDGVCASITQRYIDRVLEMCLFDSGEVALVPVQFLQVVMRLGYANPKVCISTIIALEASPNKIIKRVATELHSEVFDKHETLADRNYMEAIRMAVAYCKRINGANFMKEILFLRAVYRVVNGSYSSKKKFVLSLAKVFKVDLTLELVQDSIDQRDVIVFLALNLLVLDITSMEEVCLLLYHLDRSISREGIDLAEKITTTIGSTTGSGISVSNLQLLFVHSQSVLALIYLRHTLSAAYSVSPVVMETFRPSKADVELRQQPKAVTLLDYPLENVALGTSLNQPGAFGPVFTRLVVSVKDFTM